ncbi:hypothetical protein V6251_04310 [Olleya sp. Ti.3.14]|uniref:hypothetical protein n=1 Tax=Olleya sp. Ti.3.14 TaxID=3121297 RepID=UPI00311E1BFA
MNVLLTISIPCWLIPLLVGAICAILGYLLGRLFGGSNQDNSNNIDLNVYKNRISKLETDLAACKASKDGVSRSSGAGNTATSFTSNVTPSSTSAIKKDVVASAAPITPKVTDSSAIAFDATAAKTALGKKIKQDDLTVVEGIGPKIKELFHSHNITTWNALAGCTVQKCQEVLKSGGKRFEIHKPGTWPKQADLAAKGLWQELKDWQDQLDGGK